MIIHVGMVVKTTFSIALETEDEDFVKTFERLAQLDEQGWAKEMSDMGTGMDHVLDYSWEKVEQYLEKGD